MNSFALYHDVGCGKTLTATGIIGELVNRGLVRRVLVVAPVSVVGVWPVEVAKWADYPIRVTPLVGSGSRRVDLIKRECLSSDPVIVVTNYEAIGRSKNIQDALADYAADLVILDEAHRIKNHTAKQSKAICRLGRKASYRLVLTGTPVANLALDLFGIYQFLDPSVFGGSFTAFRARYAHTVQLPGGGMMVTGMRRELLGELSEKAHSIAHTVTKEEALDLPDFVDVDIPIIFEPKALKFYEELKRESIAYFSEQDAATAPNILTRLMRLQQATGGFVNSDNGSYYEVSSAKMSALKDVVSDAAGKVVVFARFTPEIRMITRACEEAGLNPVMIDGSVPMSERAQLVESFQNDDSVRVFVAQIQSAGLGITLTAADTAIFYSTGWSLAEYAQARGRVHRIGQNNKVTYIHLVVKDTVDELIVSRLRDKQDIADIVQNKWREVFA